MITHDYGPPDDALAPEEREVENLLAQIRAVLNYQTCTHAAILAEAAAVIVMSRARIARLTRSQRSE